MEPAMIRLLCPNLKCLSVLTVPLNARGKLVHCRSCRMNIRVPDGSPGEPPPIGEKSESEAADTVA